MKVAIADIYTKPLEYKVCNHCGTINHLDNNRCLECDDYDFNEEIEAVKDQAEAIYEEYLKDLEPDEVDTIKIEVLR